MAGCGRGLALTILPSPMADFGYDISDYTDIHPIFGTLTDDAFVAEALPARHQGDPGLRPEPHLGRAPLVRRVALLAREPQTRLVHLAGPRPRWRTPNNWQSAFGGGAWEWDEETRQYYFTPTSGSSLTSTGAIPRSGRR